jgi:hypothetical protein
MTRLDILGRVRPIAERVAVSVLLAIGVLAGTTRGTTVDFEDLSLAANSYWYGSDGSGGFTSRGACFNNLYDADYDSWSGWSYSNVNYTDTSGSDYTRQFAAITGTGVGGCGNYGVAYGCSSCQSSFGGVLPTITIPEGMQVRSAMFTNTTYAVASMLNGDQFAKQFGSDDWLKLTITGECAPGHVLGSVELYLARNGTIVNTWQSVDFSSLAALTFDLTSSDNGLYGMNTPAYFAMDSLTLSALLPGDFNVDGRVDGLDLDIWEANDGLTGSTANWYSGDANYDGTVNGLDKDIWIANAFRTLDAETMCGSVRAVPEPSGLALLASCIAAAIIVRIRRRTIGHGSRS